MVIRLFKLPIIRHPRGILNVERWWRLRPRKLFIRLQLRELKFKELNVSAGNPGMTEFTYKKPRGTRGPCILLPISDHNYTDMNLTSALSCMMAFIWLFCGKCEAAPELVSNVYRRFRSRPLPRGFTVENRFGEDDDFVDLNKRQRFDDYGHMRFGKREQFDDYGHMRFGRSHD